MAKNRLWILIGAILLALALLVAVVLLIQNDPSPTPDSGVSQTDTTPPTETTQDPTETTGEIPDNTQPTEDNGEEPQETKPADDEDKDDDNGGEEDDEGNEDEEDEDDDDDVSEELPPSVVIPPDEEHKTISFPCDVPGYDLTIEKLAPYNGMFVEDGSNVTVQNVAMLLISNNGATPVEYAQIRVECGQEAYLFDISALPAGEKLVVQEKTRKTISDCTATAVSATIVQRANMDMSQDKIQVVDNGNNTLTIKNLTKENIPTVRIFYKYYMEDEKLFVGGIAFTVRIKNLGAGASTTIQPSHYTSKTSRVVMVLTYDSEV